MKQKLFAWLGELTKRAVKRERPYVIGVTGSVGKTTTRNAIAHMVGGVESVRVAKQNYNNELGIVLAVFGLEAPGRSFVKWALLVLTALRGAYGRLPFPRVLVLEYGIDRPGDMDYLLGVVRPDVAVVSAIGEVPVHVEFFAGPREVAEEKSKLVSGVRRGGVAVLNADEDVVARMADVATGKVVMYGRGEGASVRLLGVDRLDRGGLVIEVEVVGERRRVELPRLYGAHQLSGVLAALAVGQVRDYALDDMVARLSSYEAGVGRLRLLPGIKETWVLDDTYNAAPLSTMGALEALRDFPAELVGGRRIAVLGEMAELGEYTEEAHRRVGEMAGKVADVVIGVKPKTLFLVEAAKAVGAEVMHFDSAAEAGVAVDRMLKTGDLVLVKGSQSSRMERVVKEIMAEPLRAKELLVRQSEKWLGIE